MFMCNSLSLQPFENPLATLEGVVFDLSHVVPYINKHGVNPVTGKVLKNRLMACVYNFSYL